MTRSLVSPKLLTSHDPWDSFEDNFQIERDNPALHAESCYPFPYFVYNLTVYLPHANIQFISGPTPDPNAGGSSWDNMHPIYWNIRLNRPNSRLQVRFYEIANPFPARISN